jgi:peptidoglycan/xylan/chitin deacetylase (PgdA/CDA1 family)
VITATALRLDDVGAASKRHEVYGVTRIPLGPVAVPFPGNFLFLKYLPPIKRWGPYRELKPGEWETVLGALEGAGARMTVGVTAGWVERDGQVVAFPVKFPDAAARIREGAARGLLEVANHGYTHCVLQDGLFRPRLFSGNRPYHREFLDWLPEQTHHEHLARAQSILEDFLGARVLTLIPPGNVFSPKTVSAAAKVGLRYVSCADAGRFSAADGLTFVDDARVRALHDRDLVRGGLSPFRRLLADAPAPFVTVREIGVELERGLAGREPTEPR